MSKNQVKYIQRVVMLTFGILFFVGISGIRVSADTVARVFINSNQSMTSDRKVILTLSAPSDVAYMKVSNDVELKGIAWEPFRTIRTWILSSGNGTKSVYVLYKTKDGTALPLIQDNIQLDIPKSMSVNFDIDKGMTTSTDSRLVQLRFSFSNGIQQISVSNSSNFKDSTVYQPTTGVDWMLSNAGGLKTVYVQFQDGNGNAHIVKKTIFYNAPLRNLAPRTIIKGSNSTVFFIGTDGKIHPFLNVVTFLSWYPNFNGVRFVSSVKLQSYVVGSAVCMRSGTWLLRFPVSPQIYTVEPGCQLRPIMSPAEAALLYGVDWKKRVIDMTMIDLAFYHINSYSVANPSTGVVDQDSDGLNAKTEAQYHTSDTNLDSDGDGLSDREEILYWESDPNKTDTNGDGLSDGQDVIEGKSPVSVMSITKISNHTYTYPKGTLLHIGTNFFYINQKGIADHISHSGITDNEINAKFAVIPRFTLPDSETTNQGWINGQKDLIEYPTRSSFGNVLAL